MFDEKGKLRKGIFGMKIGKFIFWQVPLMLESENSNISLRVFFCLFSLD
jgi:hypothetical protein